MTQVNEPNAYSLKGKDKMIEYTTTSFAGPPRLIYQHDKKTLTFEGKDIRHLDTEIGQLITVTIDAVNDRDTTTLTFFVPRINLGLKLNDVNFITTVIITSHQTSIGGPNLVHGILQNYLIEKFDGTAQYRYF
jgi:hypothetical protein